MGPNQLKAKADARREALRFPGMFDGHLKDLQAFAEAHPTFDLDVATEVNPALWDGTRPEGVAQLEFWGDLYHALESSPRYSSLYRYQYPSNRAGGAFGDGVDYGAPRAWLRVFEGLKPEHIVFKKIDGESVVLIDSPSILFTSGETVSRVTEPTVLYDDAPLDLGLFMQRDEVPETQALGIEFTYGEELEDVAPRVGQTNLEVLSSFLRYKAGLINLDE